MKDSDDKENEVPHPALLTLGVAFVGIATGVGSLAVIRFFQWLSAGTDFQIFMIFSLVGLLSGAGLIFWGLRIERAESKVER